MYRDSLHLQTSQSPPKRENKKKQTDILKLDFAILSIAKVVVMATDFLGSLTMNYQRGPVPLGRHQFKPHEVLRIRYSKVVILEFEQIFIRKM